MVCVWKEKMCSSKVCENLKIKLSWSCWTLQLPWDDILAYNISEADHKPSMLMGESMSRRKSWITINTWFFFKRAMPHISNIYSIQSVFMEFKDGLVKVEPASLCIVQPLTITHPM